MVMLLLWCGCGVNLCRKVPKGVTWIDGDPQSVDDLLRAGVTTARAAIVSSPILSKTKAGVEQGDLMDDINALSISCTIYKCVVASAASLGLGVPASVLLLVLPL